MGIASDCLNGLYTEEVTKNLLCNLVYSEQGFEGIHKTRRTPPSVSFAIYPKVHELSPTRDALPELLSLFLSVPDVASVGYVARCRLSSRTFSPLKAI